MDAKLLCNIKPTERSYKKQKFLNDQIIDVTSTTDKQLYGQQGLPPAKIKLEDCQQQQIPQGIQIPVKFNF